MTKNIELMIQALAEIKYDPKSWDQEVWRCDSGMCFAGWAATLDGARWVTKPESRGAYLVWARKSDLENDLEVDRTYGKPAIDVSERARLALGLNRAEANALFNSDNRYGELVRRVAEIAEITQTEVRRRVAARLAEIKAEEHAKRLKKAGFAS